MDGWMNLSITLLVVFNYFRFNSAECEDGYFGWKCKFRCQCADNAVCDKVSGQCAAGCSRNWWGLHCQLVSNCRYNDPTGFHYMGKQYFAVDNNMCRRWHHHTYAANRFKDGSLEDVRNFCRNPQNNDGNADPGGLWCYTSRYGEWKRCSIPQCDCPDLLFGVNCEKQCHCNHGNEICDKKTGHCSSGCADGWSGPDCQVCSVGRFGPQCKKQCHCQDQNEACDPVEGHCLSGCAAGYAGHSCHIEIPSLKQKPVLLNRNAHTVTIEWNEWSQSSDQGDGPVNRYVVYYKKVADKKWQKDAPSDKTRTTILGLDRNIQYIFKVAPVHADGFQGVPGPMIFVSTCGRPTSGPHLLKSTSVLEDMKRMQHLISTSTAHDQVQHARLTVTWLKPSERHYQCEDIVAYKVYYKLQSHEAFMFKTRVTTTGVTLNHLQVYTNYSIGITAINNAEMESKRAIIVAETAVGKPGVVQNTQISTSATALHVSWDVPTQRRGPITRYAVQHKQLTSSSCELTKPQWSSVIKLSPALTSHKITGLQPHSKYEVQVWGETEAGVGDIVTVHSTTLPQVPSAAPLNVNLTDVGKTYMTFMWEDLACEDRNGDFVAYEYEVLSEDRVVVTQSVRTKHITLSNLTPYVMYSFHVCFVNEKGKGPYSDIKDVVTLQDKPPAPGHVKVVSAASDSATVSWSRPDPPRGKLLMYHVWHWTDDDFSDIAKVQPYLQQYTVTKLKPNTTYSIQVRAQTEAGIGNWSNRKIIFIEEDYPSEPEQFQNVSRSTTTLTFQWQEPREKNGIIQTYKVWCEFVSRLPGQFLQSDNEMQLPSPAREYEVSGLQPGMKYQCCVQASTSKGFGQAACKVMWTAPAVFLILDCTT